MLQSSTRLPGTRYSSVKGYLPKFPLKQQRSVFKNGLVI